MSRENCEKLQYRKLSCYAPLQLGGPLRMNLVKTPCENIAKIVRPE